MGLVVFLVYWIAWSKDLTPLGILFSCDCNDLTGQSTRDAVTPGRSGGLTVRPDLPVFREVPAGLRRNFVSLHSSSLLLMSDLRLRLSCWAAECLAGPVVAASADVCNLFSAILSFSSCIPQSFKVFIEIIIHFKLSSIAASGLLPPKSAWIYWNLVNACMCVFGLDLTTK